MRIKLNDGIFHPLYNASGWRKRYWNAAYYDWKDLAEGLPVLESAKDCFNGAVIKQDVDNESGRPDGLVMTDESTATIIVTEW